MILGGGPNRIGQGIEFDYCCVHAGFALRELGFETIMVNSNPETVSTDYDTSDKLYFEPLTLEDVLNIYERENRQRPGARRHRPVRRPDPARISPKASKKTASASSAPRRRTSNSPKTARCSPKLLDELGLHQAPSGTATIAGGGPGHHSEDRLPQPRAPQLRARRPRHADRL